MAPLLSVEGVHKGFPGVLALDGRRVEIDSPRTARQLGVSIIHQEIHLVPHLTVAQNIWIGRSTVEQAVRAIRGEEVEEVVDTGSYWYDAENVDSPEIEPKPYR